MVTQVVKGARPKRGLTVHRSHERGTSLYIVVMILLIVSTMGVFAVNAARFEIRSAGYVRQLTLAAKMSEMGGFAALEEVGYNPSYFVSQMNNYQNCPSNIGTFTGSVPLCLMLMKSDIENMMGVALTTAAANLTSSSPTLGSFGATNTAGSFFVELTQADLVARPFAGSPIDGSPGTPQFFRVTVTSTGFVWADANNNGQLNFSTGEGTSAVVVKSRQYMLFGPIYQ